MAKDFPHSGLNIGAHIRRAIWTDIRRAHIRPNIGHPIASEVGNSVSGVRYDTEPVGEIDLGAGAHHIGCNRPR